MRGCHKIPDTRTREETLAFAREEFKRNKNVEDLVCFIPATLSETRIYADTEIIVTYQIPNIDRQDGLGYNGEVYSGTIIITGSPVPLVHSYSIYTSSLAYTRYHLLAASISVVCR